MIHAEGHFSFLKHVPFSFYFTHVLFSVENEFNLNSQYDHDRFSFAVYLLIPERKKFSLQ
jgi:hypothetical protein